LFDIIQRAKKIYYDLRNSEYDGVRPYYQTDLDKLNGGDMIDLIEAGSGNGNDSYDEHPIEELVDGKK
jgi:hypothetical protein